MYNQAEIEAEIALLPYNEPFLELTEDMKARVVYGSWNMLRRRFGADIITTEMAALQALYVAEGEGEEFAKFKRQAVKSMGLEGMSFSFGEGNISPEVLALVEQIRNGELPAEGGPAIFGELR